MELATDIHSYIRQFPNDSELRQEVIKLLDPDTEESKAFQRYLDLVAIGSANPLKKSKVDLVIPNYMRFISKISSERSKRE